jgi:hypothetical protein
MADSRDSRDDLGAEVRRLLDAAQEWAKKLPAAPTDHPPGECLPWCPICQFAHLLRGEHPEVTDRVAEAAASIASAMKALADAALTRAQPESSGRPRPSPAPRVERITLDDPAEG